MKKIFSLLLVAVMLLSLVPMTALADEPTGEIVLPPDCFHNLSYTFDEATHTASCAYCSYTLTEPHTFVNGVCVCGCVESPVGPEVDPSLKFYQVSMSLKDSLTFNYLIQNKVLKNYDSYYVEFTSNDWTTGEPIVNIVEGYTYYTNYQKYDVSVFSMQMTDEVIGVIHAFKDGQEYVSEANVQTIEAYALSKLPSANDNMKAVYANMLEYGAKSQIYFEYATDRLANRALGDYASYVTTEIPTVVDQSATTGTAGAVILYNTALGLREAVKPQFGVRLPSGQNVPANFYAIATYGDKELRIDGTEWTSLGSRVYTVYVQGLTAQQGKTPVQLTVYSAETDEPVSATFTYSIQSQVYKAQNNAAMAQPQKDVLNALMNYYNAVEVAYGPA